MKEEEGIPRRERDVARKTKNTRLKDRLEETVHFFQLSGQVGVLLGQAVRDSGHVEGLLPDATLQFRQVGRIGCPGTAPVLASFEALPEAPPLLLAGQLRHGELLGGAQLCDLLVERVQLLLVHLHGGPELVPLEDQLGNVRRLLANGFLEELDLLFVLGNHFGEDLVPRVGLDGLLDDASPVARPHLQVRLGVEAGTAEHLLLELMVQHLLILPQLHFLDLVS